MPLDGPSHIRIATTCGCAKRAVQWSPPLARNPGLSLVVCLRQAEWTLVVTHITWNFPDTPITVGIVLLSAIVAHILLRKSISSLTRHMAERARRRAEGRSGLAANGMRLEQRTATIGSVLRNLAAVIVWVVAGMTILSTLGVPLAPLLASAGIGGIAVAFGAQSLVKDVLAGLTMLIEDQYGVGDTIETGTVTGTVEDVTLRVTQIRDGEGTLWFVPNGQIQAVGNTSLGWSIANVDVPIAAGQDVPTAVSVLSTVAEDFGDDPEWKDVLVESPTSLGVQAVSAGVVTLRISVKTVGNQQWAPSRALREKAVDALDAAGFAPPAVPPVEPPA